MCAKKEGHLPEQGSEVNQNATNELSNFINDFRDRFTLANPRLSERYVNRELKILIRLRADTGEEYAAVLEWLGVVGPHDETCIGERLQSGHDASQMMKQVDLRDRCEGREDQIVLVDIVKSMQTPEGVAVASLVRLDKLDRILSILPHEMYLSLTTGLEFLGSLVDGERGVSVGSVVSCTHELPCEVIHCTPEVLEHIANYERHFRRNVANDHEPVLQQVRKIRLRLDSDTVRFGVLEGFKSGYKLVDVLCGPL